MKGLSSSTPDRSSLGQRIHFAKFMPSPAVALLRGSALPEQLCTGLARLDAGRRFAEGRRAK